MGHLNYRKWSESVKNVQVFVYKIMQAKVPVIIICLLCLIGIYFPNRHAIHYSYIEDENILQELQVQSSFLELNLKTCRYQNLIHENYESNVNDIYVEKTFVKPDRGIH